MTDALTRYGSLVASLPDLCVGWSDLSANAKENYIETVEIALDRRQSLLDDAVSLEERMTLLESLWPFDQAILASATWIRTAMGMDVSSYLVPMTSVSPYLIPMMGVEIGDPDLLPPPLAEAA